LKKKEADFKRELRRKILAERAMLDQNTHDEFSERISNFLITLPEIQEAKTIFSFLSFRDEANIDNFIDRAVKDGKQVYVPRTFMQEKKMVPFLFMGWESLVIGAYGIREPGPMCRFSGENVPFDVIVVPGVAFTIDGYRLGYGGGYYDRFFSQLKNRPHLVGVCFEKQIVSTMPVESHDYKVDYIVTEERIFCCSK